MNIVITSITEGIGRELAKQLTKKGHAVWGISKRDDLVNEVKNEVQNSNFRASICDSAHDEEIDAVIQDMRTSQFTPDVVIINATSYVHDITDQSFNFQLLKKSMEINFLGPMHWVERFLPLFTERNHGQFVAFSSTSSFRPDINTLSYPSSKAALVLAFRSLRLHFEKYAIQFKTIYFGPVATPDNPHWVSPNGASKYFFVTDRKKAAAFVEKILMYNGDNYYYPYFITLLLRVSLWLPDRFFARVSKLLKR